MTTEYLKDSKRGAPLLQEIEHSVQTWMRQTQPAELPANSKEDPTAVQALLCREAPSFCLPQIQQLQLPTFKICADLFSQGCGWSYVVIWNCPVFICCPGWQVHLSRGACFSWRLRALKKNKTGHIRTWLKRDQVIPEQHTVTVQH